MSNISVVRPLNSFTLLIASLNKTQPGVKSRHSRCIRRFIQTTVMSSKSDHLDRTQANSQHEVISPAKVIELKDLSATVKMMGLEVADMNFFFKPGQWLDMMIPGIETVGGYSMTSAPDLLTSQSQIHLAVKFSSHPPAHWVHTKCKLGDQVDIRAGGDFFYFPDKQQMGHDVLLLAGGVGINPLYSILQHFVYTQKEAPHKAKMSLLFSAQSEDELIFKDELVKICKDDLQLKLFATKVPARNRMIFNRRIQKEDIQDVSNSMEKSRTLVYMCGPGSFIQAMELHCLDIGVLKENIFYETWW